LLGRGSEAAFERVAARTRTPKLNNILIFVIGESGEGNDARISMEV